MIEVIDGLSYARCEVCGVLCLGFPTEQQARHAAHVLDWGVGNDLADVTLCPHHADHIDVLRIADGDEATTVLLPATAGV